MENSKLEFLEVEHKYCQILMLLNLIQKCPECENKEYNV